MKNYKDYNDLKNLIGRPQLQKDESILKAAKEYLNTDKNGVKTLIRMAKAKETKRKKLFILALVDKYKLRSVKEYHELQSKALEILRSFSTGYSMGDHRALYLLIDGKKTTFATYDNCTEYSGKWKGKETYGRVNITLSVSELRKIESVHGVWTIKRINTDRVYYFESTGTKGTYTVNKISGYCVNGTHGRTKKGIAALHEKIAIAARKVEKYKTHGDKAIFVGLSDITKVGACRAGINAFISRYELDKDLGYRLDYLKSLEPNNRFLSLVRK